MGRTGHGSQYYEFEWVWSGSGLGVHGLRLGWAWGLGTHETLWSEDSHRRLPICAA